MKIVERPNINIDKWNSLVERTPDSSFFSFAWYMDAVAENWCVLVDDSYSKGIALPFSKRAGVEVLYSPIFGRYSEMFGDLNENDLDPIKNRFKIIEFACRQEILGNSEEKIHQVITDYENRKLGSQAKRSLNKAKKNDFEIKVSEDYTAVIEKVKEELNHKFTGITEKSLEALELLFMNAQKAKMIKVFNVIGDKPLGGIVCLVSKDQVLYLKGAVNEETKSNGGMYLALNAAIDFAKENNLKFDFGGSNIEGVKRFNYNLGGVDETYFMHILNNGPAWFKLARKVKSRFKNR